MPLRLDVKRKLLARSDRVKSVDLHPTEPWMLVSLYNGNVHIWNYDNQQLVKSFEVCDLPVRAAKFVAQKNWIVTGSDDMFVRVFNYNTLERVHQFEAHSDYLRCIAVHPTQPYFLTSSDDMTIKLWDWDNKWANKQVFEGHTHYVMQVVINPKDNNTFATAALDRTVKVWQFGSSQPNFTLEGHEKGVNCVDYYHGGDKPYLISGADDRLVKIWDYQNKNCVATLDGHATNISAVCFHPELPVILTGSEDSTVRMWHMNTYRLETTLNYGLERVWCIAALRGSNTVCVGYDEGSVVIKLGREEPVVSMDSSGKILWAKHSEVQQSNLKTLASDEADEIRDGERLPLSIKDNGACEIYPQTLQHSSNGRLLVACGDGEYTAMELRNKKEIDMLRLQQLGTNDQAVSGGKRDRGRYLADPNLEESVVEETMTGQMLIQLVTPRRPQISRSVSSPLLKSAKGQEAAATADDLLSDVFEKSVVSETEEIVGKETDFDFKGKVLALESDDVLSEQMKFLHDRNRELEDKMLEKDRENTHLVQEIDKVNTESAKLVTKNKDLEWEKRSLMEQVQANMRDNNVLRGQIVRLESAASVRNKEKGDMDALQRSLSQSQTELRRKDGHIKELEKMLGNSKDKIDRYKDEADYLRSSLGQVTTSAKNCEIVLAENKELKEEIAKMVSQVEAVKDVQENAERQYEDEISRFRCIVAQKEKKIAALEVQVNRVHTEERTGSSDVTSTGTCLENGQYKAAHDRLLAEKDALQENTASSILRQIVALGQSAALLMGNTDIVDKINEDAIPSD